MARILRTIGRIHSHGHSVFVDVFSGRRAGKPNGRGTERLAWAYYQEFDPKADIIISLHSGGSVRNIFRVIYHNDIPASLEIAKEFGCGYGLIVDTAYSVD